MFGLGTGELLLIGIVVFIFLGPKKLPQLGASLAQGLKNFKNGMNGIVEENSQNRQSKEETKDDL